MTSATRSWSILFLILLWTTAPLPGIPPEGDGRAVMLVDDFEDGNLWDTWSGNCGPCTGSIVTPSTFTCAEGAMCLEMDGACDTFYNGIYTDLLGFQADNLSLYMRADRVDTANAYISIDDDSDWLNGNVLNFFGNGLGKWMIASGPISYDCGTRNADQWYFVYFEFDWTNRTVSVWIDGTLRQADVAMTSTTATGLNYMYLYNYQEGTSYYDYITARSNPPPPPIFIDGFESGGVSAWSAAVGLVI